jgi:hypothetical protein
MRYVLRSRPRMDRVTPCVPSHCWCGSHGELNGASRHGIRKALQTTRRTGLPLLSAWATPCSKCAHGGSSWSKVCQKKDSPISGSHCALSSPLRVLRVEGIANQEYPGHCRNATTPPSGEDVGGWCWWGENVLGQLRRPVRLSLPERLVLSPHAYGHGDQPYMFVPNFPSNMPDIWEALWGRLPDLTGVPVVM